jgi:hypothetical protein
MNRRQLLALLGAGGAGGAGALLADDLITNDEKQKQPSDTTTPTQTPVNSGSSERATWVAEAEQQLSRPDLFNEPSFLAEELSASFSSEEAPLIERLEARPTDVKGDIFVFTADPNRSDLLATYLRSTLRVGSAMSKTITVNNNDIRMSGGESPIGEIMAFIGTSSGSSRVVLVRAQSKRALDAVLSSNVEF